MNMRMIALKYIIENPGCTRIDIETNTSLDRASLGQIVYQLRRQDVLNHDGDTRNMTQCKWYCTDKGLEYYERNKDNTWTPPAKKKKQPVEMQQAPTLPNISLTAEGLADQVSAVLAENSELRNALSDMRGIINKLLGEDTPMATEGNDHG